MDQISGGTGGPRASEAVAHLDRVWRVGARPSASDAQGVRMEVACELDVVGVPRVPTLYSGIRAGGQVCVELKTAHAAQLMLYAHALRLRTGPVSAGLQDGRGRWTLYSAERGAAFARNSRSARNTPV
jgi:hypothetical protein